MPGSSTATRRLEWLTTQRERTYAELTQMAERAAGEDRDLSDAEQTAAQARRGELERLDAEVQTEAELARAQGAYQSLMADIGPAVADRPDPPHLDRAERQNPASPVHYRSPGEYLVDVFLRNDPDHGGPQRAARLAEFFRAHQLTTDNPGIIPTPVVGPVWTTISSRRPAIEAATQRPLPTGGKTFTRPHVTQHTLVGDQATEKTEIPSRPLKIDPLTVTKRTKGGYVNLSWQDRDWTEPGIVDLVISDLAAMYAQATDAQFCYDFAGAVIQTETVATDDTAGWLGALYAAAATIAGVDNRLPTTLWASLDMWARLGSLVDGAGRPLFPAGTPVNSMGELSPNALTGMIGPFKLSADAHLADGTLILGDNFAVEFFEQVGGQVSATEPSVLGTDIAFFGYMADVVVEPAAFVKIIAPVGAAAAGAAPTGRAGKAGNDKGADKGAGDKGAE